MKNLAATSLIIVCFFQLPGKAQTIELCRPSTNNILQRVSQKISFPFSPSCDKKKSKIILYHQYNFRLDARDRFIGSDRKRYIRVGGNKLIIEPKKR